MAGAGGVNVEKQTKEIFNKYKKEGKKTPRGPTSLSNPHFYFSQRFLIKWEMLYERQHANVIFQFMKLYP